MDTLAESPHPSPEKLRTFGLGRLAAAEASAIEEHLARCEPCCRTVAEARSDTFIALLRSARRPLPQAPTIAPTEGAGAREPAAAAGEGRTLAEEPAEPLAVGVPPELAGHPRYRVLGLLGAGGMGAVYKAQHRLMERVVALKVMARTLVGSAVNMERFRREFKASARLAHPNIVAAYDAEQAGDLDFLVMEYVEGTDLARWVAERGPLPVGEACDYVRQAALGLQHAHEHGMIHRDIKPHNLMRARDGTVKILDFGLARLAADAGSVQSAVTGQGTLLGTVDYLAPEQADDARRADIRSDIYSLGCTLYHLLSGRPPFPHGTLVQKIMAHTERQPRSLLDLRPDLPPRLARVVGRLMAKDPEDRYQTPAQVAAALEPFGGATAVLGRADAPPRPAPGRRPRREEAPLEVLPAEPARFPLWPVAVAVLLLALGGLAAAAVAVYRIQTDNGELLVTTDDPDVEVVIKQNGRVVQVLDPKTNRQVTLTSGVYDLEVGGRPDDFRLAPDRVTIRRGDTTVATVERLRGQVGTAGPSRAAEILRDPFNGLDNRPAHVYDVAFSGDGRYFLAAGDAGPRSPVRVYDGKTGQRVSHFVRPGQAGWSGAAFSPDGRRVVSWDNEGGTAYVWESATGRLLGKLEGHRQEVVRAAFSPDGKRVVTGSADRTLRIWDAETGRELRRLEGHTTVCVGVFSPDGKWVLSFSEDRTLRGWDAATGKEVWKQLGQGLSNLRLTSWGHFSPDGARVFSVADDGRVHVWQVATGKAVAELPGPAKARGACFLPDGRLASWGEDSVVRVWDLATGKEVRRLAPGMTLGYEPDNVAVSPDGRLLLTGHDDHTVRVCELATGKELHRYPTDPRSRTRCLVFSPDGRFAAAGSFRGWVYLWRLPEEAVGEVRRFAWGTREVQSAAFSPDESLAAAGDGEGVVRVWDLRTGTEVRRLPAHRAAVYAVAFLPGGDRVVSGGRDAVVRLSDVTTGAEVRRFDGHQHGVVRLALSADGRRLLSGDDGGGVRLWDVDSGRELRRLGGHTGMVHALAFAPDGRTAVSGSTDGTVRWWDLETGQEVRRGDAGAGVTGLAFSADGRQLLTSDQAGLLRWWDAGTGRELRRFAVQADTLQGLALAADGRRAVTAGGGTVRGKSWGRGTDFTVRLWDVAAGRELQRFVGHRDVVNWVTLSPSGNYALSASLDGTLRLWRLPAPPPPAK